MDFFYGLTTGRGTDWSPSGSDYERPEDPDDGDDTSYERFRGGRRDNSRDDISSTRRTQQQHAAGNKKDATPRDATQQEANSTMRKSNKSLYIVEHPNGRWEFASAKLVKKPGELLVLELVDRKWALGPPPPPFTPGPDSGEHSYEWSKYTKDVDRMMSMKGVASQWQKMLYISTWAGSEVKSLINTHNWTPDEPQEGIRHYDVLMNTIAKYFDTYTDKIIAQENLMKAKQGVDEPIAKFWKRVEKLAIVAKKGEDTDLVRNIFVAGLMDGDLKQQASDQDWDTDKVKAIGNRRENKVNAEKAQNPIKHVKEEVLAIAKETTDKRSGGEKRDHSHFHPYAPREGNYGKGKPSSGSGYRNYGTSNDGRAGTSSGFGRSFQQGFGRSSQQGFGRHNDQGGYRNDQRYQSRGQNLQQETIFERCKNCDRRHDPTRYCSASDKVCHECGKKGHIRVCCSGKGEMVNEVMKNE